MYFTRCVFPWTENCLNFDEVPNRNFRGGNNCAMLKPSEKDSTGRKIRKLAKEYDYVMKDLEKSEDERIEREVFRSMKSYIVNRKSTDISIFERNRIKRENMEFLMKGKE